MSNIAYPTELTDEIRKLFPDYKNLYRLLDEGSPVVGSILSGFLSFPISADQVIVNIKAGDTAKVLEAAELAIARKDAYDRWLLIFNKEFE